MCAWWTFCACLSVKSEFCVCGSSMRCCACVSVCGTSGCSSPPLQAIPQYRLIINNWCVWCAAPLGSNCDDHGTVWNRAPFRIYPPYHAFKEIIKDIIWKHMWEQMTSFTHQRNKLDHLIQLIHFRLFPICFLIVVLLRFEALASNLINNISRNCLKSQRLRIWLQALTGAP